MKKFLLTIAGFTVMVALYIITTAQKTPDKGKYYYAFSEKFT